MDAAAAIEFGKLFGFPALCLGVLVVLLWKATSWFGREILKPTMDDLRSLIRAAVPAAIQIRDDVADVKVANGRIEQKVDAVAAGLKAKTA